MSAVNFSKWEVILFFKMFAGTINFNAILSKRESSTVLNIEKKLILK